MRVRHLVAWSPWVLGIFLSVPLLLPSPPLLAGAPDVDADGDGFTPNDGDCCDGLSDGCTLPTAVNPAAMEFVGNDLDDDCDGAVDEVESCNEDFLIDDGDAYHGAAVLGLCRIAQSGWDSGVVDASYRRSNGAAVADLGLSRGLLNDFGSNIQLPVNRRMLVLSTGTARDGTDPGACGGVSCATLGTGSAPFGFPQDITGCPPVNTINDDPALQLTLRAPSNASGFLLRYRFFTHDWPEWVCNSYNDQMLILVDPPPDNSINGNIAINDNDEPMSVNNADITVCDPDDPAGSICTDGDDDLVGTGFDSSAAATRWLPAGADILPMQTFHLRLTVMDVGDQTFDSTALFDDFEWLLAPARTVALFKDGLESSP